MTTDTTMPTVVRTDTAAAARRMPRMTFSPARDRVWRSEYSAPRPGADIGEALTR
jgi:hypothetical protein